MMIKILPLFIAALVGGFSAGAVDYFHTNANIDNSAIVQVQPANVQAASDSSDLFLNASSGSALNN
jgi:hypothetical protein